MLETSLFDETKKPHLPKYLAFRLGVLGVTSFSVGGSIYLWSTRANYTASYFLVDNSFMTVERILLLQPFQFLISHFGISIANSSRRVLGSIRNVYLVLALVLGLGSATTLLFNSFWWLLFVRSLIGTAAGVAWFQPLGLAWSTFPKQKGLIFGCFASANFFMLIIFNQITTWIVNPHDEKPQIDNKYFKGDILERVPIMFYTLGGIYAAMMLFAALCAFEQPRMGNLSTLEELREEPQMLPTPEETKKSEISSFMAFKGMLKELNLWLLCLMIMAAIIGPSILINNFKCYGLMLLFGDEELTYSLNIILIFVPILKLCIPVFVEYTGNQKFLIPVLIISTITSIFFSQVVPVSIFYYSMLSALLIWSYHIIGTIQVTFISAEFPKEIQAMVISHVGNFLSFGDMFGQSMMVLGLNFNQVFYASIGFSTIALLVLFVLRDGYLVKTKYPPRLHSSAETKEITLT